MRGYTDFDKARQFDESAKNPGRTSFERDRARILHSAALRRLGAKTQVLGPNSDDFVRTRLTHTLEVAQVGREIGKALGCDPDVVDAACLAHDLGHPPFGHNGERALAEAAVSIGGFEGNAQTLRLLTRLEAKVFDGDRSVGLNLTRASLDASIKYPWGIESAPRRPGGFGKFGVYHDDRAAFEWVRDGVPDRTRCIEAQVMDLADDIAYSVHDVEDAVVSARVDLENVDGDREQIVATTLDWYGDSICGDHLHEAIDRVMALPYVVQGFDGSRRALAALKDMTSSLIGRFSRAAQDATRERFGDGPLTRYAASLVVPTATLAEILVLKGTAATYVMAPREREPVYSYQRDILHDLVRVLSERAPTALEPAFADDWRRAPDDAARLRVVIDQVASLTDISATRWHARLVRPGT